MPDDQNHPSDAGDKRRKTVSDERTITKCPTCGSEVTVGGDGETHFYILVTCKNCEAMKETMSTLQDEAGRCHAAEVAAREELARMLETLWIIANQEPFSITPLAYLDLQRIAKEALSPSVGKGNV